MSHSEIIDSVIEKAQDYALMNAYVPVQLQEFIEIEIDKKSNSAKIKSKTFSEKGKTSKIQSTKKK